VALFVYVRLDRISKCYHIFLFVWFIWVYPYKPYDILHIYTTLRNFIWINTIQHRKSVYRGVNDTASQISRYRSHSVRWILTDAIHNLVPILIKYRKINYRRERDTIKAITTRYRKCSSSRVSLGIITMRIATDPLRVLSVIHHRNRTLPWRGGDSSEARCHWCIDDGLHALYLLTATFGRRYDWNRYCNRCIRGVGHAPVFHDFCW